MIYRKEKNNKNDKKEGMGRSKNSLYSLARSVIKILH